MTGYRSSLASIAHLANEPQDSAAWGASTRAWREKGIVMIDPERLHSFGDREYLIAMANRLFGKRENGGVNDGQAGV